MGKYMKYLFPVMMIAFTLFWTSALALYITIGSLVQTGLGYGSNYIIDKIIKRQEAKRNEEKPDMTIINPHAKYFKGNKGKK
jgi:membrane protein insertase Oxa1/YidC/SpoIIIJ